MADDGSVTDSGEGLNLPDPYRIPDHLLEEWAKLPPEFQITPMLPRAAWDALYAAIDQINFAVIAGARIAATTLGSKEEMEKAVIDMGKHSIQAQSSLRHFQEALMAEAVRTSKDG